MRKELKKNIRPCWSSKADFSSLLQGLVRDKIQELLADVLCEVSSEVDGDRRDQVSASDSYQVAVLVETAIFEKWCKSSDSRQMQNEKIKQRALFECERGGAPQPSTGHFSCGR
ncbi:transcription elongation factor TFIIS-like [Olea europaea subsp. europaea]|uniref:Transcription elongation factor TFIIS-like n=1 Tax=Olea europaea subsp. europaea TaxID=158383 RepID=A0A8S0VM44_OLEEU|nr:transcription elongation factor TFIIS-like [Olea europaea subsp. europaea]